MQLKTSQKVTLGFASLTIFVVAMLFVMYFSVRSVVLGQTKEYLLGLLEAPIMTTKLPMRKPWCNSEITLKI